MSRPKSILITGYVNSLDKDVPADTWYRCSPGSIGEALSHQFIQRGCTVCSTGLPSETLPELEAAGAHVFPLDVRSEESVKELELHVSKVLDAELDILINCA